MINSLAFNHFILQSTREAFFTLYPVSDRPWASVLLHHAAFHAYSPAAHRLTVWHESFERVYQWRRGLWAITACLWRDYNTVKRDVRENHESKHISFPTPFLFLPVCLSQSLAQVWRSGSSSLAAPAGRRFSLQGSLPFHSLTKLTLLLSSLLSQPGCPTRKALVSSGSHQLSDSAFPGEPWHLKRKLAARVSRTCHQASESVCHSAFLLFLQGLS